MSVFDTQHQRAAWLVAILGVLIVLGQGSDGPADEIEARAREEVRKLLPIAASLGQNPDVVAQGYSGLIATVGKLDSHGQPAPKIEAPVTASGARPRYSP